MSFIMFYNFFRCEGKECSGAHSCCTVQMNIVCCSAVEKYIACCSAVDMYIVSAYTDKATHAVYQEVLFSFSYPFTLFPHMQLSS